MPTRSNSLFPRTASGSRLLSCRCRRHPIASSSRPTAAGGRSPGPANRRLLLRQFPGLGTLADATGSTPRAVSDSKRRAMQAQRTRDTSPERVLRSELFRMGYRYRLHQRVVPGLRRCIDIVFPRQRVAVDVRGCFWHACPQHATTPKHNSAWWSEKLARNAERDRDTEKQLRQAGWLVVVVWEHEDPRRAALRVARVVERQRSTERTTCGRDS